MEQRFQYVNQKIASITTDPGCYLMKDNKGNIFYIGKAKNLRQRLKSYIKKTDTRLFVQFLEHILYDIDIVVVHNDSEALILERELIRKYKPKYNISLKDDKNYILLKLKKSLLSDKKSEAYPRLEIVRQIKKDKAQYFGPYPSANKLRSTVAIINKYFRLRTCSDQVLKNRIRPCMEYQIGRCLAPCVFAIDSYQDEVNDVIDFLNGSIKNLINRLHHKMLILSDEYQYERAAKIRDQINAIKTSLIPQVISDVNKRRNQDIIGFSRQGPLVFILVMSIRKGNFDRNHSYFLKDQMFPDEEIARSFIEIFYSDIAKENIPDDIILPFNISSDINGLIKELALKSKVRTIYPQKGKLKNLLLMAHKNAHYALEEKLKENNNYEQGLLGLQNMLGLLIKPKKIECIDISIMQGSEPFGSLVVFIDGKPDKSKYRLFKIKTVEGMDDFSMIKEVVSRRIKKGLKDSDLPDLLLIDGGKGQLNAALKALEEENIIINNQGFFVSSIAKARTLKNNDDITIKHSDERLFIPGQDHPLILKHHSLERYLVERIRDEAHRFAITAHRRSQKNRSLKSKLNK